jgi:hypothetical protein
MSAPVVMLFHTSDPPTGSAMDIPSAPSCTEDPVAAPIDAQLSCICWQKRISIAASPRRCRSRKQCSNARADRFSDDVIFGDGVRVVYQIWIRQQDKGY